MNLQHQKIIQAAERLCIDVICLDDYGEKDAVILRHNGREEWVVDGNFLSQLNLQNHLLCNNKQLTKEVFVRLDIPHPQSLVFADFENELAAIKKFWREGAIYVCKPLSGTEGEGVAMNISSLQQLENYWQNWRGKSDYFLLEEQVDGADLRLQAIDGKLAAACIREPAFIVGDGENSVESLIEKRREIIKKQNPANRIDIDASLMELLQQQKLSMQSIPDSGQNVQLKYIANMSQGARAIDVTDKIHPQYSQWLEQFADETGMRLFALDVIAEDCTIYKPGTAWALEVNPQPEWLHHTFSEGKTHDIAGMILEELFEISS
ncbi:MAG: hypothetical protein DWQ05_16525 [Calditrichaeota bacterium]|nr:MAG: hypothetical protein DWQ05_16525 [Calditrichota bacterium]